MLPLSPYLKDAFEKFEQDLLAYNLPEGKYIKLPATTAIWYKVGQPCFEDKLQELNSDFAKICISPKPSGTPMGKVTFKKVKSQIQKGGNPEKAARRGYENACDYFEVLNKRIRIQQRALACLSKSLAHILQRELCTMGHTGLLRQEAEMTLLQPHLGDSRRQELRNSPFWPTPLFKSQLVKDEKDFLL